MKGVESTVDAAAEPNELEYVDRVLQQFAARKQDRESNRIIGLIAPKLGLDQRLNQLDFVWNADGSLDTLIVDNASGSYALHFTWKPDGLLDKILREER